jgi:hypothetical protein
VGRVERPALRGTLLGWLLKRWNPVMLRLLMSRLHWPWSGWFLVITWTGRKSGRRYSTPASYGGADGMLLITTGDAWWRNLHGGAEVGIWLRGRKRRGIAEPVSDPNESLRLHELMFARQPLFGLLAGIRGPGQRQQIRKAIGAGRMMIRIRTLASDGD